MLRILPLSLLTLTAGEQRAAAEDATYEYADGVKACEDFDARNERELAT